MTNAPLTIVGRSSAGQPRTPSMARTHPDRDAAYRRLVVTALGLDVATLAAELQNRRLRGEVAQAA
ncbi:MAG: hypothetical protein JOZ81_14215 [Chloroflexi bacterium]|nr:hypothetical protein [Chloroflexota bacterium]MBV9545193.1 hypothetical protein [Chloroflexota bacterium]